ncbi:MAG: 30S ribosomal protein S7 [Candidatus Diapherotrites archaeon]|nr:30S ribosomal protein S7 [Candidatus Diapherotrites archaeon]
MNMAGKKKQTTGKILLFGRWDTSDVVVSDVSLKDYISLRPVIVPHTHGRHAKRHMAKKDVPIVERLINKLMRSGQGSSKLGGRYIRGRGGCGKKLQAMKIVEEAFEIVEQKTKKNPVQVLVDAVINAAPREDVVRVQMGGVFVPVAVDVSPLRALDVALRNISLAAFSKSFNTNVSAAEALAEELIAAANNDPKSFAVMRREEIERIARQSR